jgi:preprotein translocase subunit YajC
MFVSPAYAQTATGAAPGTTDLILQFVPLILIFVIFYFFLIRPQQQKAKQHKAMLDALRRGDQVITQGGMHAKIVRVADDSVEAEIAPNVKVKLVKATIAAVVGKTEPANDN